jgi:hypothetical protein
MALSYLLRLIFGAKAREPLLRIIACQPVHCPLPSFCDEPCSFLFLSIEKRSHNATSPAIAKPENPIVQLIDRSFLVH